MMGMRRAFTATLAVLAIVLPTFFISASATHLPLQPINNLKASKHSACTLSTINSLEVAGKIQITHIPTSCIGLTIRSEVVRSNGTQSYTATITSNSITFPTALITPNLVIGVRTLIDGWNIPTTWTYQKVTSTPIAPNPTTPNVNVVPTWNQTAPTKYCVTVTVTTSSTKYIDWLADISYLLPPFNSDANMSHYVITPAGYDFIAGTPSNGLFSIRGTTPATERVKAGDPRVFTVCNNNTPPPGISPTAIYTQTQAGLPFLPNFRPCKTVTVSVTNAPFYVGWESIVNVQDLKGKFLGIGGSVKLPPSAQFSATSLGSNNWLIKGLTPTNMAIKNGQPVSYEICWGF